MMFSATLSKEIRPVCKKFMQDVISPFSTWPCTNGSDGTNCSCKIIQTDSLGIVLKHTIAVPLCGLENTYCGGGPRDKNSLLVSNLGVKYRQMQSKQSQSRSRRSNFIYTHLVPFTFPIKSVGKKVKQQNQHLHQQRFVEGGWVGEG